MGEVAAQKLKSRMDVMCEISLFSVMAEELVVWRGLVLASFLSQSLDVHGAGNHYRGENILVE